VPWLLVAFVLVAGVAGAWVLWTSRGPDHPMED
jgi:beta-lactam-binding protein with PASTA domain